MQVQTLREFDNHERVIRLYDPEIGLSGFIAIHKRRGNKPCLGATRLWRYSSEDDALNDALRLSRLMTHKSALAGLPYGGAKAVLIESPKMLKNREKVFSRYGQVIERLGGIFVTGSDVGVNNEDVLIMRNNSNYIIGADVPAGYYTALGVMEGIYAVLEELYGSSNIEGRSFAIQGLGKTGFELFKLLSKEAKTIMVADMNEDTIAKVKKIRSDVKVIQPSEIHIQKVDVFCPCALNHSINKGTISGISCKAVAGAANNQLESKEMGDLLHEKNILYAPDYVVNSGGLISVVDQFENKTILASRIKEKVKEIQKTLGIIFKESKQKYKPPHVVADMVAQHIFNSSNKKKNIMNKGD